MQLRLPENVRFVRATGADASQASDGTLTLRVGSMFSGDERRIIVELDTRIPAGDARGIGGLVQWTRVGAGGAEAGFGNLILAATTDLGQANASRDGRVLASATSVSASQLQLEAAEAYAKGDALRAQALIDQKREGSRQGRGGRAGGDGRVDPEAVGGVQVAQADDGEARDGRGQLRREEGGLGGQQQPRPGGLVRGA